MEMNNSNAFSETIFVLYFQENNLTTDFQRTIGKNKIVWRKTVLQKFHAKNCKTVNGSLFYKQNKKIRNVTKFSHKTTQMSENQDTKWGLFSND